MKVPSVALILDQDADSKADKAEKKAVHHGDSTPHLANKDVAGLVMTFTVCHGLLMAQFEIHGLPNLIAWWIFPWQTVSHNQRVKIMETLEYHGNIVGIGRDQVSKYGSIWENLPFGSCRKRCIRMA